MLHANIQTKIQLHQIDNSFVTKDIDQLINKSYFVLIVVAMQH